MASSVESRGSIGLISATSLGVGLMVGAGIFALMGEAAAIAGGAVYISFIIGGVIALLNGYSLARLGVRYPSAGGANEYIIRGWGDNLFSGAMIVLFYFAILASMAMVSQAFGNYAASLFLGEEGGIWVRIFASAIIVIMVLINAVGSEAVGRSEIVIVSIKLSVLVVFVVASAITIDPENLSTSTYAPVSDILFSVALTFFAFVGFTVINNSVEDMDNPTKTLPRAMYLSISVVILLYVGISFAVFGNLTVQEVIADKDTVLAEAARPVFGNVGFTVMALTALLATSSAILSGLFQSMNMTFGLARDGQMPPALERRVWRHGTAGLLISAGIVLVLANFFPLGETAAIASLSHLGVFAAVNAGHLRLTGETSASRWIIILALVAVITTIALFVVYTSEHHRSALFAFIGFTMLAVAIDYLFRRFRHRSIRSTLATPVESENTGGV